jgi:hypothetical protein
MHMLIGTNYQAVRWPAMGEDEEGQEEGSEPASGGVGDGEDSDGGDPQSEEEEENIPRTRGLKGKKRARESDEDGEEGTIMPIPKKQDLIDQTFVALVTPQVSNADPYDEDNLCHSRSETSQFEDDLGLHRLTGSTGDDFTMDINMKVGLTSPKYHLTLDLGKLFHETPDTLILNDAQRIAASWIIETIPKRRGCLLAERAGFGKVWPNFA